jgi:hypothetical protein
MMFQHIRNQTLRLAAACGFAALGLLGCTGGNISGGSLADGSSAGGSYSDFPAGPIGAGGVTPTQVPSLITAFANAPGQPAGGPCMTEPTMGALFPSNFNSPLFEWSPPNGHNIFELSFHVPNQTNDLIVYTDQRTFTIADSMWSALSADSADQDIQVRVRSGVLSAGQLSGGVSTGTVGTVRIAPVPAQGSIVYWTTSGGSALKGFHIGDKSVITVLTPASITSAGAPTTCVGCHIATPDGSAAVFGRANPAFTMDARLVDGSSRRPSWLSQKALAQLGSADQAMGTMSSAWYSPPSRAIVVTSLMNASTGNKFELVWTNLAATTGGLGIVRRMGDALQAATPMFNSTGTKLAYTASNAVFNSCVGTGIGEVWTVPYNNGQGGAATGLPGASNASFNQYYPAYSPGDTFVAFNRIPRGGMMYNSPAAEIFLVPGGGGTPVRIVGNDPPACAGLMSPGQTNSWPRWSPTSMASGSKRYYWLVFSSRRRPSTLPQLYLSGVITDTSTGAETLTATTPAVYLPNQPSGESNHTPAWDLFQLPSVG